jgi:hypothetical protein
MVLAVTIQRWFLGTLVSEFTRHVHGRGDMGAARPISSKSGAMPCEPTPQKLGALSHASNRSKGKLCFPPAL